MAGVEREIHLRPGRVEDAAAIASIWHLGWRDGHYDHVAGEVIAVRTAESFAERAPQRLNDTAVALVGDEVAGFVMVVDDELEQIYVSADFRARGVADVLLDAAERRIKEAGHRSCWLAVVPGNERAMRFYRRHGWSDDGIFDYEAAGQNGPIIIPSHRYTKPLT